MSRVTPIGPEATRVGLPDLLVHHINQHLEPNWTQAEALSGRDIDVGSLGLEFMGEILDAYRARGWSVKQRKKSPNVLRFIRGLDGMDLVVGERR